MTGTINKPTWRRQILTTNGWIQNGKRKQIGKRKSVLKYRRYLGHYVEIKFHPLAKGYVLRDL